MLEYFNTYSNIIQTIIGVLSLAATIVVSVCIYKLQKRHERELEKMEEGIRKRALEEEAHRFLIDNEKERDYLPWCVFAANLHRHEKHTRKIYTNFCRSSLELQCEILRIAQFSICPIEDAEEWVTDAIELLCEDIKKYELSERDYLYDDAKYFRMAFEKFRETAWEDAPRIFEPINKSKQFMNICFSDGKLTIGEYIDEYIRHYIGKSGFCLYKPVPPFDKAWEENNLYEADEEVVCRWMLELVFYTTTIIYNRDSKGSASEKLYQNRTDAQVETFEDRYLETLMILYYTYGKGRKSEKLLTDRSAIDDKE